MLTFTYHGGTTVKIKNGKKTLVAFADAKSKPADDELFLLVNPEDEARESVVSWPGEYDIEGIAILGIGHEEGAVVSYAAEMNGVRCGFLASPLRDMTDHELEILGDVDVLVIPSDDPKIVQKLVDEIDPRVLIPLNTGGAEKHAETLKICGAQAQSEEDKYELKGSLPAEGRVVVLLSEQK